MKISRRMKIAGLAAIAIIVVLAIAFVGFIAFMFYVGGDALSNNATGSELLRPDGPVTGQALVVYNPGLSGDPKTVAAQIAGDLKARGYEVTLAGVNSSAAKNVTGYSVVIAGGPIYGGKVSPSIYSYLQSLAPPANAKVGAFASGTSVTSNGFPAADWLKVTAVLNPGDNAQRAAFEASLLQ